jgi:hypothetical protein
MKVYPEFIRQIGGERGANERWDIIRCAGIRGAPKTSIATNTMHVPLDGDETARHIRAHELMHVRLSPPDLRPWIKRGRASFDSLLAAEEARINRVLANLGFDPKTHLLDINDGNNAYTCAKAKDMRRLVYGTSAVFGTASWGSWMEGISKACEEIKDYTTRDSIENLAESIGEILESYKYELSSDKRIPGSRKNLMSRGFAVTERIAMLLDKCASLAEETGTIPSFAKRNDQLSADMNAKFADLCQGQAPLTRLHNGNLGKVKLASPTGRNPRRIHRMLTDPYRRIFDRTKRNSGGVVLIDGSGSMSVESEDILKILNAAPGATVALYAHKEGSKNVPNFWVLAKDGKMVDKLPHRHGGGNGVDGPALRWAIKAKRFQNEPVLWVCDGAVTDGKNDSTYSHLTAEARVLAIKAKAIMHRRIGDAVSYLKKVAQGQAQSGPLLIGEIACGY